MPGIPLHVLEMVGDDYIKRVQDATYRTHFALAWLRKSDGFRPVNTGMTTHELVRYKRSRAVALPRGDVSSFTPNWEYKRMTYNLRALKNEDSIDIQDILDSRSPNAMVDLFAQKQPGIVDGMIVTLQESFYADGSTDMNVLRGVGTIAKLDTAYAVTASDRVGIPYTNYNGISTRPGDYNGDWDSTPTANAAFGKAWPFGKGDHQFDFASPVPYNDSTNYYGHASSTWRGGNAFNILDAASARMRTNTRGISPTIHVMGDTKFLDFLELVRQRNYQLLPHTPSRELGFPETLTYNGGVVTTDFYCPSNRHYTLNLNHVKLKYIKELPQGFRSTPSEVGNIMHTKVEEIPGSTYTVFRVYFFGDYFFEPKYVAWSDSLS